MHTGEFDEGPDYATYRRRGTTDWLLVQTLDGQGRFGHVRAEPGSVTLVRPGTLHDYATVGDRWHFLYAHVHPKPDWLPLLDWPEVAPGIVQLQPAAPPSTGSPTICATPYGTSAASFHRPSS